ncbi:cytokine receptor common subunit beta-like isoform X2 [Hyperolius riggenbachi]|uniref:cytokine receptor common subunit beta-like isoform X2 n=1 Tax=Hyperolius riggenbachi TaxID=752182 RepID=UPI0035A3BAF1
MKKNNILYCVTFCLLSAISDNQVTCEPREAMASETFDDAKLRRKGSKLLESLFCYTQYPSIKMHCSWSESLLSGQLLNMSLVIVNKSESICQKTKLASSSFTHQAWMCTVPLKSPTWMDSIKMGFLPERSLERWLNAPEDRDEAKPQELHCDETDGNRIICSWKVRKEIAESIDFMLFYSKDKRDEQCFPTCQEGNPPYLFCQCTIDGQVNTSALAVLKTIHISPRKVEDSYKIYILCSNISLPANSSILTINETKKGEIFIASVKNAVPLTDISKYFKYHYELCYWRQDDLKSHEVPNDCPDKFKEIISRHQEPSVKFQLGKKLDPSSNYSMRVRVRLNESNPTSCYNGPWSEWSRVQTLQTKAVLNATLLYVLIPTCVIVIVMCALCGYRALKRYTTQWNDRIPNPGKSSIINGFQKTKARFSLTNGATNLQYGEHVYVEPCNNVVMWTSSTSKDTAHLKQDEVCTITPTIEPALDDDPQSIFVCNPSENYPTASLTEGYQPFTEVMTEQENEQEYSDTEDSQFAYSAFDGPYLFYKNSSS